MKKEIIGFIVAFILSHLVSMYIMGGYDNQTLTSKIIATIIGCIIGFAFAMFINIENTNK
jgi:tetrahydromethanopterin S-methyltransferase subunit F